MGAKYSDKWCEDFADQASIIRSPPLRIAKTIKAQTTNFRWFHDLGWFSVILAVLHVRNSGYVRFSWGTKCR